MTVKPKLTIADLKKEAKIFCEKMSSQKIFDLYGVTDGKAVGTFVEHSFQSYLQEKYEYIQPTFPTLDR